jgi:hypothetical protein
MTLVRPRLTDYYGVLVAQAEVDFAIPFLDEDLPLAVDPFLLWKSPSQQDNALHLTVINAFNHLGSLVKAGKEDEATRLLIAASECDEVGLGLSHKRKGKRIGRGTAHEVLSLFQDIPTYRDSGFLHVEEIQLFVDQIGRDRICDITCNFVKSFLIDFTIDQCKTHGIPIEESEINAVYNDRTNRFVAERVPLPVDPEGKQPIVFVPKRWLRRAPWLNFDDYYSDYCPTEKIDPSNPPDRVRVLNFNRQNYGIVRDYIAAKELCKDDCKNDPLFSQIPVTSAKTALKAIKQLSTGITNLNDKKYEREVSRLLASLLYPQLDFAATQSRTESGVLIRDLIFYNNQRHPFLQELTRDYNSRQLVFELKNVQAIEREHINQLHRYLKDEFGRFGVLVTRVPPPKAMKRNLIDLWAGRRVCILTLTDSDLDQMVHLYESRQRDPVDVLKRNYVEFMRECPS